MYVFCHSAWSYLKSLVSIRIIDIKSLTIDIKSLTSLARYILIHCKVTVGFSIAISATFTPFPIKLGTHFSVTFTVILDIADSTHLVLERPTQFNYRFINL